MKSLQVDVCIAGGGPAGMLLGLLLAKLGVRVLVAEQHRDFAREYRGEVLMPRFTQLFRRLGLFEILEKQPHLKLAGAELFYQNKKIGGIDFQKVVPEIPFALWMPQPALLQALHDKACEYPSFQMLFDASAKSLLRDGTQTTGVVIKQGHGEDLEVRAKITAGTDGRFSTLRRAGNFKLAYSEHQFDIVWFTIPKPEGYENLLRFFLSGKRNLLALPKYPDSIQCGLPVAKGEYAEFRKQGIESIRKALLDTNPLVYEFARNLKDFSPFNVLQAELDLIENWEQDGLLLVGDSAHTMSPVGAVGVSIAVETAAVAAGIIYRGLEKNDVSAATLGKIQEIREPAVREIHKIQHNLSSLFFGNHPVGRLIQPFMLPFVLKLPFLRKIQRKLAYSEIPVPLDPAIAN